MYYLGTKLICIVNTNQKNNMDNLDRRSHRGEVRRFIAQALEPVFMAIRAMTDCLPEIEQIEINVKLTSRAKLVRRFVRDEAGIFRLVD